jgi:hypothetical protein
MALVLNKSSLRLTQAKFYGNPQLSSNVNISQGTGITLTPNPILGTGTIAVTNPFSPPVTVSQGGTGVLTFSAGYLKSPGGTGAIISQAVPIPIADGGTGTTALPTNNSVLFTSAGVFAGDNTKLNWNGAQLGVNLGGAASNAPLEVSAGAGAPIAAIAVRAGAFLSEGALQFFSNNGLTPYGQLSSTASATKLFSPSGGEVALYANGTKYFQIQSTGLVNTIGGSATPFSSLVLANGINSNIALSMASYYYVSGPVGPYSIGGFSPTADGRRLTLYCSPSATITVLNEDVGSTAANRIKTLSGADFVFSSSSPAILEFIYDASEQRWILSESGVNAGYIKANGTVPLTDVWTAGPYRINSLNSIVVYNVVTGYGADSGGTVDATSAIQNAITDCGMAGGGTVYIPPGTYRVVQSGAATPLTVAYGYVSIVGAGRGVTNIKFEPATGGECIRFNTGVVPQNYNRIADLSFYSLDYLTQKTMIRCYDLNNFEIERVSTGPGLLWMGASSIGVRFQGRQELRLRDCEITADLPVVIDRNPNFPGISFDHSSVESSDLIVSNYSGTGTFTATGTSVTGITPALAAVNALVGWTVQINGVVGTVASNTTTTITLNAGWGGSSGAQTFRAQPANYAITINDDTVLTNCSFVNLATVCGIGAISWNQTISATASQVILIDGVRTEQGIRGGDYGIDLRSTAQVQSLNIKNIQLEAGTSPAIPNGIRLTGAKWPYLETVSYGGTGVFLNLSATVNGLTIMNSFRQAGSTITDSSIYPTAVQLTFGANPPITVFGSLSLSGSAPFAVNATSMFGATANPTGAQMEIIKNSTYNTEASAGLYLRSGSGATNAGLMLGSDKANNNGYIQTIEPSTSYSTKPLFLNPNGGKVAVGSINASAKLDITGSLGARSAGNLTLANGRNDNVTIGDTTFIQGIAGPTLAFQISGIVPTSTNGQVVILSYNGGQVWTINHNDANSTAANRIYCPGNVNKTPSVTAGSAILVYNPGFPGWQLIAFF